VPDPGDEYAPRGEPCPAGAYCPVGALTPTLCPNGTVNAYRYGATDAVCVSCPSGFECTTGNPVPA
jgi:hypothetical protein